MLNVPASDAAHSLADAHSLVEFWREAGPQAWFAKNDDFDRRFRETFYGAHEAAAQGKLDAWLAEPASALALVLLLDQFPRNAFRGTPRMFATDEQARRVADRALELGHDGAVDPTLKLFFYLPLQHSEDAADQERAVALCEQLDGETQKYAALHRDIIRRFGRFPHRNAVLGRASTPEELQYLAQGGFAG